MCMSFKAFSKSNLTKISKHLEPFYLLSVQQHFIHHAFQHYFPLLTAHLSVYNEKIVLELGLEAYDGY